MKNQFHARLATILLVVSLSLNFTGCSQTPASVRFFTGTWNELLAEAKKQNKPIFVEVHTVWCGPCRQMEKQAFPNPDVARKFNANFINYHIDMEQGEGPMLREQYAITGVPTLLYLTPNGTLVYRSSGYNDIASLLADADKGLAAAESSAQLSALETDYKNGRRDMQFLRTYLTQHARMRQPAPEALELYMKQIPARDWESAENIRLMTRNNLTSTSATFNWLLNYVDGLHTDQSKASTRWAIIEMVDRITTAELERATTRAEVEEAIALRERSLGPLTADNKAFLANRIWTTFYKRTKNQAGYRKIALPVASRFMAKPIDSLRAADAYSAALAEKIAAKRAKVVPASLSTEAAPKPPYGRHSGYVANELHSFTSTYLLIMTSPADLKQALAWSERTIELTPAWEFLDTHAQLLVRLGRGDEAIQTEKRVIALAKAAGEPTAQYEKVLSEMTRQPKQ
jgi:thiol-disulfide isomerase/thioredoxin